MRTLGSVSIGRGATSPAPRRMPGEPATHPQPRITDRQLDDRPVVDGTRRRYADGPRWYAYSSGSH